ncbi:MAG: ATP-binding protein, partial [Clostridia bacterium]|nr:ATP-binding protein [Clostridia bacterium]
MLERNYYLNQIISKMWDGNIKVITGIRRCGKSTLLFELFNNYLINNGIKEENIIKIELDKRRDLKFRNPILLCEYVENRIKNQEDKYFLFIDEVQLTTISKDKESGINVTIYDMLNELKGYKNLDCYVTGSNSKMLSSDIATEFRGRSSQIKVYPLSFSELYSFRQIDKRDLLNEYMQYGGMPGLINIDKDEDKKDYLNNLYNEIYLKDLVEHGKIKREDVLDKMLDYLASQISSLTNSSNIANSINVKSSNKIDDGLITRYLNQLEDSFLISKAKRYDIKGKKYFDYPNKYYYCDLV